MGALIALTLANIRSYVRDRAALFWTLAFPLIFIFLFGFIFQGGGGSDLELGWVDEDRSAESAQLREAFAASEGVVLADNGREAALASMQDGEIDAVIIVPAGYGVRVGRSRLGDGGAKPDRGPHRRLAATAPGFGLPGGRQRARRRQPRGSRPARGPAAADAFAQALAPSRPKG